MLTAVDFRNLIKTGRLNGIYLFYGDEEYMKQFCLNAVRESLIESGDVFNHFKLTQDNYSAAALSGIIESLPVFADKKLIEIHSLNFNSMKESETDEIINVLSIVNDYDFNVIILYISPGLINAKTLKLFEKTASFVQFDYETPVKLIKWIQQHFKANKIIAEPDVCSHLINQTGRSMFGLKNEIDKLSAYILSNGRNIVTTEDINTVTVQVITIDTFDFANAVLDKNIERAVYILSDMKLNKEKPEIILSGMSRVYADMSIIKSLHETGMAVNVIAAKLKMHEFKTSLYLKSAAKRSSEGIRRAVELCYEADVKIKSTALDNYAVLDRLLVEISQIS